MLPWRDAVISGWILDPDRKKMSKVKGNVVTPMGLLEQHGADAVRYWAANGRPGTDLAFDPAQMRGRPATGHQAAQRVEVRARPRRRGRRADPVTEPLDRSMLAELATWSRPRRPPSSAYDHTAALQVTETFFWPFCDDYIELVKERAYGTGRLGDRPGRRWRRRCPYSCGCSLRCCRT